MTCDSPHFEKLGVELFSKRLFFVQSSGRHNILQNPHPESKRLYYSRVQPSNLACFPCLSLKDPQHTSSLFAFNLSSTMKNRKPYWKSHAWPRRTPAKNSHLTDNNGRSKKSVHNFNENLKQFKRSIISRPDECHHHKPSPSREMFYWRLLKHQNSARN